MYTYNYKVIAKAVIYTMRSLLGQMCIINLPVSVKSHRN